MSIKYLLQIDKAVLKDLQDLQAKQYKQVVSKLLSLSLQPYQQDCKALKALIKESLEYFFMRKKQQKNKWGRFRFFG
jgi:mRNA-degrading endonuclease RelE of RelBE toxin-antitoxin system